MQYDNQIVDAETGFTDYDVERFGVDKGIIPEHLDIVAHPRPSLVVPDGILNETILAKLEF